MSSSVLETESNCGIAESNCGIASAVLALACRGKGILACDESVGTIGKSALIDNALLFSRSLSRVPSS